MEDDPAAAFRCYHGVDGIFEHKGFVGHLHCQGAATAAFTDHITHGWRVGITEPADRIRYEERLSPHFRFHAWVSAISIYYGYHRYPVFFCLRQHFQSKAEAFGLHHARGLVFLPFAGFFLSQDDTVDAVHSAGGSDQ